MMSASETYLREALCRGVVPVDCVAVVLADCDARTEALRAEVEQLTAALDEAEACILEMRSQFLRVEELPAVPVPAAELPESTIEAEAVEVVRAKSGAKPRPRFDLICEQCGRPFQHRVSSIRFCGSSCSGRAHQARLKAARVAKLATREPAADQSPSAAMVPASVPETWISAAIGAPEALVGRVVRSVRDLDTGANSFVGRHAVGNAVRVNAPGTMLEVRFRHRDVWMPLEELEVMLPQAEAAI